MTVAVCPAQAGAVVGQGTWQTTLQGRDLDGNAANGYEAYYDTALNITWLANANYAKTSGYDADGLMSWDAANTWAAQLNIYGITGWRLPTMVDTGTSGCNYSAAGGTDCGYNVQTKDASTGVVYSELAYLWYVTLGNKGQYAPVTGDYQNNAGFGNTGSFSNVDDAGHYWFGASYAPDTSKAWYFGSAFGRQNYKAKALGTYAWAVHSGDVTSAASVPEPQTYALALAGLAVGLVARKLKLAGRR